MGCGPSSRSPARVGVFVEDDEDALYPELFPRLVDSWVQESARHAPSYCDSSSPPPYTPLPLSGHVTLMVGHGSSPAKRQVSVGTSLPQQRADSSVLETSFQEEMRVSVASEVDRGETEVTAAATASVRPDMSDTGISSPNTATVGGHSSAPDGSVSGTTVTDDPDRSCIATMATSAIRQSSIPNHTLALSSSFPPARPPSPYPRTRSLSVQLPPLRIMHTEEQRPGTSLSLTHTEQNPFRLPPLALQRQQSSPEPDISTSDLQCKSVRKRSRVRSRSCQIETSGLGSVQEQTVAVLQ